MSDPTSMKSPGTDRPAATRRTAMRIALVVLVVATTASLLHFVRPAYYSFYDAAIYVLTGKSIACGDGYRLLGEAYSLRAPGFAAMLAPVIAIWGLDYYALNMLISLSGVVAVSLLLVYGERRVGVAIAFALCAMLWLHPIFRRYSNIVMSDLPGLVALFGCFLVERRVRTRGLHPAWLGVAIGLTLWVRSVYTILLPALAVSWLLRKWPDPTPLGARLRRIAVVFGVAIVVIAPWEIWKRVDPAPYPSETAGVYSLTTGLFHTDPGDPMSPRISVDAFLGRVLLRVEQSLTALGSWLRIHEHGPVAAVMGVVFVALLLVACLRRRDLATVFALLNLAALLVFNDWSYRLMLPVFVVGLLAIVELLRNIGHRIAPRAAVDGVLAVALLAAALVGGRFDPVNAGLERRHADNVVVRKFIEKHYGPDVVVAACLGHTIAPVFKRDVLFCEPVLSRAGAPGLCEWFERHDVRIVIDTGRQNGYLRAGLHAAIPESRLVAHRGELLVYERAPRAAIRVSGGGDSIQRAIERASHGDRILVEPGEYGPVDFRGKAIALVAVDGPERTTIRSSDERPAVQIVRVALKGARVAGFTIVGCAVADAGGVFSVQASPLIEGNVFRGCGGRQAAAIALRGGGRGVVVDNVFVDCTAPTDRMIFADSNVTLVEARNERRP